MGAVSGQLLLMNLPYNCSERELEDWIESRGIEVQSRRIIRDLVTGSSPAFACIGLKDDGRLEEAITLLNGKRMRSNAITVTRSSVRQRNNQSGEGCSHVAR